MYDRMKNVLQIDTIVWHKPSYLRICTKQAVARIYQGAKGRREKKPVSIHDLTIWAHMVVKIQIFLHPPREYIRNGVICYRERYHEKSIQGGTENKRKSFRSCGKFKTCEKLGSFFLASWIKTNIKRKTSLASRVKSQTRGVEPPTDWGVEVRSQMVFFSLFLSYEDIAPIQNTRLSFASWDGKVEM